MENLENNMMTTDPIKEVVPKKRNYKPLIITASIVAALGLAGATAWVIISNQNNSSSNQSDSSATTTTNGDQKITKGGSYTFTGIISGRIVIETDEDVTVALKDVTLSCSTDQAAIKGKGTNTVTIVLEGTNKITSVGDGINVENNLEIKGDGSITIEAGDDGIHADRKLTITSGTYTISAVEGLEATHVIINGGTISISASDDGINASQKVDDITPTLEINNGSVTIKMAQGDTDGLDSNGNLYINGGTVDITGQSAIDYDGEAKLNGGKLIINSTETNKITNQFEGEGGGMGPGGGQMQNSEPPAMSNNNQQGNAQMRQHTNYQS